MKLPSDPFMLLSVINTKLRDEFPDFDELCGSLGIEKYDLITKLASIGFTYDPTINQFK